MLELLWVCDPAEAASHAVQPTQLWERWSRRADSASRFGLIYGGAPPPVSTRPYHPPYLPHGRSIEVGCDIPPGEPALFFMPWLARRTVTHERPEHAVPIREVTGVTLGVPEPDALSCPTRSLCSAGLLSVFKASAQVLEIRFRSETNREIDCRPRLPLVFRGSP
jgi:hypothetical protein